MKQSTGNTIFDIVNYYQTTEELTTISASCFDSPKDMCLFYYLSNKYLIVDSDFSTLKELFSQKEAFFYNYKSLIDLICDENYFAIFKENIEITIRDFVSASRKNYSNKNVVEWEMINELIEIFNETKTTNKKNINSALVDLSFNELEDRNIPLYKLFDMLNNYSKYIFYDYATFILYKAKKDDERLFEINVKLSAIPFFNKLIELDNTYKEDDIYLRDDNWKSRRMLRSKKLSKKTI